MSDRFQFPSNELRRRTLRGVVIAGAFIVLIDVLVLTQGLIVTRVLGPRLIGVYGIASTFVLSLIALKRVGVDEAFVAQEEPDQEREFQIAFTLDLVLAGICALSICALAPLVGVLWRNERLVGLTAALAYLPLALALQAPMWVFFRRMDFARQRSLQAVQPAVAIAITVPLVLAGIGVWGIVIGQALGYAVAVVAGIRISPYRLRLRFDRAAARRYVGFSAPIFVTAVAALLIAQGQTLAFNLHGGLAAAGFLTLALLLTRYVDRADQVVTASIYPAICAIKGQTHRLEELFVKSNRATLLWVLPFSGALILFAPDVQRLLLGPRWHPAVVLVQGLAIATALAQLGFNWFAFYRAHGNNRPVAVEACIGTVMFLVLAIPGLLLAGTVGFVVGRIVGVAVVAGVRRHYVRRLLPGVRYAAIVRPALLPLGAAAAAVLVVRFAAWGDGRPLVQSALEFALFVVVYVIAITRSERRLMSELLGGLRGRATRADTLDPARELQ
jgi:O-antigen/teichoic acid export membrane protein